MNKPVALTLTTECFDAGGKNHKCEHEYAIDDNMLEVLTHIFHSIRHTQPGEKLVITIDRPSALNGIDKLWTGETDGTA